VSRKTVVESESGNSTMQASTKRKMLRGNSVTAEEFRERKDELAKAKKNGETEKGEGK